MLFAGRNTFVKLGRFVSLVVCFALVLSSLPAHFKRDSAYAQSSGGAGSKRQLPPNYKLPNLNSLITEGKKSQRTDLPRPPLKPSTLCGYRDEACKRKKEKEGKVGQNFTPLKDNAAQVFDGVKHAGSDAYPGAMLNDNAAQVFDGVARKRDRNWLGRFGRVFTSILPGITSVSAKGNSFSASELNRSAGNLTPTPFNSIAAGAAPAMPPPYFNTEVEAKLDPRNRIGGPGVDLFSGNYNFTLSLVKLPGRGGLDLNIPLSLNSLVWLRYGYAVSYDYDYFPSLTPGFRMGFPELEGPYVVNGVNTYIVHLPSGRRVEMRQAATNQFEAIDSSYLYLTVNVDQTITLYSTDGTQYKFEQPNPYSPRHCTQIKDNNGNYISIAYKIIGSYLTVIDKVTDTLGREIFFNYDSNLHLLSITQNWNGQTFYWAQFDYGVKHVAPNFGSLYVEGPLNMDIPVITRVIMGNGARYTFDYNSWGQVSVITSLGEADNPRTQMVYAFPGTSSPQSECPRFTQRNDGIYGWPGQIYDPNTGFGWSVNYFYFDPNETFGQATGPDGVTHKEIFSTSGGTRGLTTRTETHFGGAIQQFTDITWASDSAASPPLRPRVTETKICDDRNHNGTYQSGTDKLSKTTIEYTTVSGTIKLPWKVREYNEGGGSVYRSTKTDYVTDGNYLSRRIIGLPNFTYLYEGDQTTLKAQTEYVYDSPNGGGTTFLQEYASVRQHDTGNYGTGFSYRGNLTKARRYSVVNGVAGSYIETKTGYYITGNPAWAKDGANHETTITYDDSFLHYTEPSPGELNVTTVSSSPPTYAYPTKVTIDETPADVISTASYNYNFGAVTRAVDPKEYALHGPNPTTMRVNTYDSKGRPDKALIWKDGSKYSQTRYAYGTDHNWTQTWTTVNNLSEETWVLSLLDGVSRERITISEHPTSQGGLKSAYRVFDVMGRVSEWSNVIEVNGSWAPYGDDAAGYPYSRQAFDWKGRPTVLTNQDGTTSTINYTGCGCAGSDVTELIDEVGRKRKVYRDVFGREEKVEALNWNGTVYSTQINTYNVRDQITQVSQIVQSGGGSQITTTQYDGHGRLWKQRTPIESGDTIYEYYDDDKVFRVTDARQAAATFTYYGRPLVQDITYTVPAGVAATPNVHYAYDENGNRTLMNDGLGTVTYSYDSLSRMESETRYFTELARSYSLTHAYNLAGQVKRVSFESPSFPGDNTHVYYDYNKTAEMTAVTGSPYAGVTQYVTEMKYRAWSDAKSLRYGNNRILTAGYNARQQVQSLQLKKLDETKEMDKVYQYYPDGRIKFSDDSLNNEEFDRAFNYDQVGRLQEGWSGIQARNFINQVPIGTDVVPYHLVYQYDVWGNRLSQTGELWSVPMNESATYQNNRRSGWQYDAAGNVISDGVIPFQYDAAGRNVSVVSGFDTSTEAFDGDGLTVRRDPVLPSHIPNDSSPIFYMRSTILGGKVIAEINGMAPGSGWVIPRGGKLQSYVYHGASMVAVQEMIGTTPPTQRLEWRQIDPISGTELRTASGDFMLRQSEPDPQGVHVGFVDPAQQQPPPPEEEQPSYFGAGTWDPDRPTFTLDGIRVDEAFVIEMLTGPGASAVVAPGEEYVRIIRNGKPQLARFQAYADGYQGYVPVGERYLGNGQIGSGGGAIFKGAGGMPLYASSSKKGDTDLARLNGATGEEAVLGRSLSFGSAQYQSVVIDTERFVVSNIDKLIKEVEAGNVSYLDKNNIAQCARLPLAWQNDQEGFIESRLKRSRRLTENWERGARLKYGMDIKPGTVVATFSLNDGRYPRADSSEQRENHTAIFVEWQVRGGVQGMRVIQQMSDLNGKADFGFIPFDNNNRYFRNAHRFSCVEIPTGK